MYLTCWVCNNFDICPNNMGLIMCFLLSFFLHHITDRWLSSLCKFQYFSFMHASNVSKARIKIYLFFRDFSSLLSELGNRGSALLVAEARDESNGTLTEELENATNIYAKLQKVICGRDLSSEEASGSLLGGSSNQ